jgi:Ca2+-binding EF-hand superfamily protein
MYQLTGLGSITVEEFGKVMKASGHNATDAEIAQIIKDVDLNGDGTINFNGVISSSITSIWKVTYILYRVHRYDDWQNQTCRSR